MCVANCQVFPGYVAVGNRCFKGNGTEADDGMSFLQALSQDMARSWYLILICFVVAFVFSYIILVLFRYAIKYVIWIIYIGIIVLLTVGCIGGFIAFFVANNDEKTRESAPAFLVVGGICGLLAIIIAIILFCFRQRIRLVIQLFREASKAIADIPMITIEPIATFLSLIASFFVFLFFVIVIASAGHLTVHNDENGKFSKASYEPDAGIITAHVVNFIALIWFVQFIMGCQHFIIASTISDWYFARSKDKLDAPISRAFSNLLSFHLGSVCLGSLLLTAIQIARMIVQGIKVRPHFERYFTPSNLLFPELFERVNKSRCKNRR